MQQPDLCFIRHGESTKNEAAHNYRIQRNIPFDWDLFVKDPVFLKTVTHNPEHIDSHLSKKGKEECLAAREKFKGYNPDIILVSPLQRALETCRFIFQGRQVPFIVEPLLSETFKHSSEICRSIEAKKKAFPEFDFSRVQSEGQFWFIKNDSVENQKRYFQFLAEVDSEYYHQKIESIIQFMEKEKMFESAANVRERARKMKQILKGYRAKYQKIAIVSHFYTIRFLCCTEFDEKNEPKDHLCMPNCGMYETTLEEICKYN